MAKRLLKHIEPNEDQKKALSALHSNVNVFLTGPAGVGKSFVIQKYLEEKSKKIPVLASTGAAAVLVGGRTLHSFFGLGIMEGGLAKTIARASENSRVRKRISQTKEIIIDEISMIHSQAFLAADEIAKAVNDNTSPFGGIRVILVGDFFQLPPVDRFEKKISWLFQSDLWEALDPQVVQLTRSMRTQDQSFVDILNKIRSGRCDEEVQTFLNSHIQPLRPDFKGTVLFGRKAEAESYNQQMLDSLSSKLCKFETEAILSVGVQTKKETLIGYSPLPEVLYLKEGALVMIRKNDPEGEYVNGSLGVVQKVANDSVKVKLHSGSTVTIPQDDFQILDGDGKVVASIRNFPLTLGWATTIHKSQGTSIDQLYVNLRGLWENGQAYVALSRAKNPDKLFIEQWSLQSIKADPAVVKFYSYYDNRDEHHEEEKNFEYY